MGVFSTNGFDSFGATEIVARENFHTTEANRILVEGAQNDMAFFEAIMVNDFNEVRGLKEGTLLESELASLNEGSTEGFFAKIREMMRTIFEKIKAVLKAFYTKITTIFVRDGKKLVKMHEKSVFGKDLSKMKYKYREQNNEIKKMTLPDFSERLTIPFGSEDSYEEANKKNKDGSLLDAYLTGALNGKSTSASDFTKDAAEFFFKDKEEKTGLGYDKLRKIMDEICTMKDALKTLKDQETEADKKATNGLRLIKEMERKALDCVKSSTSKSNGDAGAELILRSVNVLREQVGIYQQAVTKITTAKINALKVDTRQNRAVFAKAAAFNPDLVKESAELFDAIDESVEYEVEDAFENYEY